MAYNIHPSRIFGLSFEFGGLSCDRILKRFEVESAKLLVLPCKLQTYRDHAISAVEGTGSLCSEELIKHLNTLINYLTKYMEQRLS